MPNLAAIIASHNKKLLYPKINSDKTCNCRIYKDCPMDGKCLSKNVVYRAEIITDNNCESFIGLTATSFKERWRNHMASIKKSENNPCQLVKHVKKLKEKNICYIINWEILTTATPFSQISNVFNLCINEKYYILYKPELGSLNTRNELTSNCRHKSSKLMDKG